MSNDNRPPETLLQGCADFRRAPLYRAADPTLNIRTATPSALSFPALNGGACCALGHRSEPSDLSIAYVNQPSELHSLLSSCDLPIADVIIREGLFLFAIRDAQGAALATIGLELCGGIGLLRSLAVASNQRQRGLAARLVTFIEQLAQVLQLPALYLLTISAAEYFQRHGYQSLARENTPPAVQQSRQFRELCPDVAQVLYKLM